jgi:hypothetical protein
MPVEPIGLLEADQDLAALIVVERGEKTRRRLGDAPGGVDGLGAGRAERQKRSGSEDFPPGWPGMAVRMVMPAPVVARMPAVVRHGARQAALRPYFRLQP